MTWSKEQIKTLTELWELGLSGNQIGKILGRTKNSIVGKAHRLKLPGRPSPIKPTKTAAALAKKAAAKRVAGIGVRGRRAAAARAVSMAREAGVPSRLNAPNEPIQPCRVATPIQPRTCQWIEDEPTADDSCKCGAPLARPADPRCSYCKKHEDIAYDRPAKQPEEEDQAA